MRFMSNSFTHELVFKIIKQIPTIILVVVIILGKTNCGTKNVNRHKLKGNSDREEKNKTVKMEKNDTLLCLDIVCVCVCVCTVTCHRYRGYTFL
jgi:hypothetical protein